MVSNAERDKVLGLIQSHLHNGKEPDNLITINIKGHPQQFSPLFLAANYGDILTIDQLLDLGAGIDRPGTVQLLTPLMGAIYAGMSEVAQHLLAKGASTTIRSLDQQTPLHAAIFVGDLDTLRLMLTGEPKSYEEFLHFAVLRGKADSIRVLEEYGVALGNLDGAENPTITGHIYTSIIFGEPATSAKYLAEYRDGAIPHNYPPAAKLQFLAAKYGRTEVLHQLGEAGHQFNAVSDEGLTAFMAAAARPGNLDALKELAAYGADPKATDNYGHTALNYAADERVQEYLVNLGVQSGNNQTWSHIIPLQFTSLKDFVLATKFRMSEEEQRPHYLSLSPKCNMHGREVGLVHDSALTQTFIMCESFPQTSRSMCDSLLNYHRPGEGFYQPIGPNCDGHGNYVGFCDSADNVRYQFCSHIDGFFPLEAKAQECTQLITYLAANNLNYELSATYPTNNSKTVAGHVYCGWEEPVGNVVLIDAWVLSSVPQHTEL